MANFTNPMTDALKLIQTETIHKGWFTPAPAINVEEGFLLEHYRGSVHINSYTSSQLSSARRVSDIKDGDTIFRLNFGPRTQLIEGRLRTWEGYTRPYQFFIDLQIGNPAQLLILYRQDADPVDQAIRAIKEAIQQYADRTIYEEILPLNLVAKAQSAFDREPGRCKVGIRILEIHDPILGPDPNYQPIKLRQFLSLKGSLTTLDRYVRPYEVQIELEVVDLYDYKHHDMTGEKPLNLVEATIHGELQRYVHQCFYEVLTALNLHTYIENNVFATFPKQARAGLKITRANNFSLGDDRSYQPVPKIHMLTISNTLKTIEGYERAYQVQVELQVINLLVHLQRSREGTIPLSLAQAVIEGEILQFAGRQAYEILNDETLLFKQVEHAFDKLTNGETGGLGIKLVHFFILQPASDYTMARILDITGEIKTADIRVCPYTMTVEVKVGDAVTYAQLKREGTDPHKLALAAITGAIEELARGKSHDEALKLNLIQTAHEIFERTPNAMIGGLRITKAHKARIEIDNTIQAIADIEHAREIESSELLAKSSLMELAQSKEFILNKSAKIHEFELTLAQQQAAEAKNLFAMKQEQMRALSQGQIDFWQKAFQIASEELESGTPIPDVFNNMQTLIQNIQGNFPQIASNQAPNGQTQVQGSRAQIPALKPGQPVIEGEPKIIDVASESKPAKKPWPEAGLTLMEVPVPPTLRPFLDDREYAFQIREIGTDSPAQKAGLRKGDFLTDIENQEIHVLNDIDEAFASITNTYEIQVFVVRSGSLEPHTLYLLEREEK